MTQEKGFIVMTNDIVKNTENKDDVFRTNGHILDEATFYEVKQYLYPVFKQKVIIAIAVIAMIVGVVLFVTVKPVLGIILVVFGLLFFMDALVARGRAVRKSIKQIRQITGKDHCTYNYALNEKDLFVRCVETNMNEHIPFTNLARRTETKNAIVLFTKESRMIIFRKNKLSEKEKKEMLKIVDERCPEMTYVPHKGYTAEK